MRDRETANFFFFSICIGVIGSLLTGTFVTFSYLNNLAEIMWHLGADEDFPNYRDLL